MLIQANVTPVDAVLPGRRDRVDVVHEVLGHHHEDRHRYNFTPEKTRSLSGPDCEPNNGYGGFDINVWRYFRKPGASALVRSEKFHTTYTPSDTVICKPEKRTTPPSEDAGD